MERFEIGMRTAYGVVIAIDGNRAVIATQAGPQVMALAKVEPLPHGEGSTRQIGGPKASVTALRCNRAPAPFFRQDFGSVALQVAA